MEVDTKESQIYNWKWDCIYDNNIDIVNKGNMKMCKSDLAKAGGGWVLQAKGLEAGTSWHIPRNEEGF